MNPDSQAPDSDVSHLDKLCEENEIKWRNEREGLAIPSFPRSCDLLHADAIKRIVADSMVYPGAGMDISPVRLFHPGAPQSHEQVHFRCFLMFDNYRFNTSLPDGRDFLEKVNHQIPGTQLQGDIRSFELEDLFSGIVEETIAEVADYAANLDRRVPLAGRITAEDLRVPNGDHRGFPVAAAGLNVSEDLRRQGREGFFADFKINGELILVGHFHCDAILGLALLKKKTGILPRGLVIQYHGLANNAWPSWGAPITEFLTTGDVMPPEIIWEGEDRDYSYMQKVRREYREIASLQAVDSQYQDERRLYRRIS